MEIERKWDVAGWPEEALPVLETYEMEQGYLCTRPTVRIRKEALLGGKTAYILCIKGKADALGLAREEIELSVSEEEFRRMQAVIGKPLIKKVRRTYLLPDGAHLEVNEVDAGLPTHFFYAEVEFASREAALGWIPPTEGLQAYLNKDCTGQPGSTMAEYWIQTRD